MAEILIAPHAVTASSQVTGRSNEGRTNEAVRADTEAEAPTPFAAVLKSKSETKAADSTKENASATEVQAAADETATAAAPPAPTDPSALLSLLIVDSPRTAPVAQTEFASTRSTRIPDVADTLTVTASAPSSVTASTVVGALFPAPTAEPASSLPPEPTVATAGSISPNGISFEASPAPTVSIGEARSAEKNRPDQRNAVSADLARERNTSPDKLAVDAAITAESGKTGAASTASDSGGGDFRALMEHMANNPVNVAVQTSATSTAASSGPALRVETPLGEAGWHDEMGQKLTWMVSNNRQQAELVLNPPQLGRIEVTLTIDGDRASASFASPYANVRETLENSMARLREALADAGVTLGQTHVGADSRHDPNSMDPKNDEFAFGRKDREPYAATIGEMTSGSASRFATGRGMVDVFA
ncbi:MAG: flagellar hook-length control protein FliK [Rhodocyclales bacterium]|nr:flagellar hook-length control protein FliK [Rhodocyclales bacterium]